MSALECSKNCENCLKILVSLDIHVHIHMEKAGLESREGKHIIFSTNQRQSDQNVQGSLWQHSSVSAQGPGVSLVSERPSLRRNSGVVGKWALPISNDGFVTKCLHHHEQNIHTF